MYFDTIKSLINEGPLTIYVDGECMTGTLKDGGRLSVEQKSLYWPGDVIVFARGDNSLVSHRFLGYARGRSGWLALTRADVSNSADCPCHVSRILGKVQSVENTRIKCTRGHRLKAVFHYFEALMHTLMTRLGKIRAAA